MSKKEKKAPVSPAPTHAPSASSSRLATVIVWGLMGAYAAVFTTICLVKYVYFLYTDFDFAICAQAAWGITHGQLYNSIRGMYWLGDHSWFTMFLVAPIYALIRTPATLLVLQSVVIALGALPVFWLARREMKNSAVAVCFAAVYLLYPAVGYMNLFEFHPETMATTTLLFAFYYLWVGRFWMTMVFSVLSLMAKENAPLVVGMMGLYALTIKRPRRWVYTAALVGLAVVFLGVSFLVLKPALNHGEANYAQMYARWGPTLGEAAANVAKHPVEAVSEFFYTPDNPLDTQVKGQYWLHLLMPVMFLSLLSPLTLAIALPVVGQHLLSFRTSEHAIVHHYTKLVIPFFILASVLGLRNLLSLLAGTMKDGLAEAAMNAKTPSRTLGVLLAGMTVAAAIVCNLLFGPVVGHDVMIVGPRDEAIWPGSLQRTMRPVMERMLAQVPATGTVAGSFQFLPRLANRPSVHSWHHILGGKYSVSDKVYSPPTDAVALIADLNDARTMSFINPQSSELARSFITRNGLAPVEAFGDLVLFLKNPAKPLALWELTDKEPERRYRADYNGELSLLGWDAPPIAAERGGVLPLRTFWKCRQHKADPEAFRYYLMQLALVDESNSPAAVCSRRLGYTIYPVQDWPVGAGVAENYSLVIPEDARIGKYNLLMRVIWIPPRGLQLTEAEMREESQIRVITLGSVDIVAAPGEPIAPR